MPKDRHRERDSTIARPFKVINDDEHIQKIPLLLILALSLPACESEPEPRVDTGLPADKKGSDLDLDEQARICEAREEYADSRVGDFHDLFQRFTCTGSAIFTAQQSGGSVEACRAAQETCLKSPPMIVASDCTVPDWSTCEATIDQLERCLTDSADATIAFMESVSCERIEEYNGEPPRMDASMRTSRCKSAAAVCPALSGGPSGGSSS
jgi:hypothetical protein